MQNAIIKLLQWTKTARVIMTSTSKRFDLKLYTYSDNQDIYNLHVKYIVDVFHNIALVYNIIMMHNSFFIIIINIVQSNDYYYLIFFEIVARKKFEEKFSDILFASTNFEFNRFFTKASYELRQKLNSSFTRTNTVI